MKRTLIGLISIVTILSVFSSISEAQWPYQTSKPQLQESEPRLQDDTVYNLLAPDLAITQVAVDNFMDTCESEVPISDPDGNLSTETTTTPCEKESYDLTIVNKGSAISDETRISVMAYITYKYENGTVCVLAWQHIGPLGKGESTTVSFPVDPNRPRTWGDYPIDHSIIFSVDSSNVIKESSETNNSWAVDIF